MAGSFNFCTSEAIVYKAGANVSSSAAASAALLQSYYDWAEGLVVAETRRDWVKNKSSVASGALLALGHAISDLAAMKLINYDMSGYTSRLEAQTMLDVLKDNSNRVIGVLKDFKSNEIKSV